MLPVFDGHNDTLTRDDAADFATGRAEGHLDLPRARKGGLAGGIFALFTPTPGEHEPHFAKGPDGSMEAPLDDPIGDDVAAPYAGRAAGRLLALERAGHVRLVRGPGDLDAAREAGVLAAVMHLEGAEAIDPDLDTLEVWYAAGLRSLGPVWSRANAFGHGVPFRFPATPDTGPGLTDAGIRLVRRCAELGIAIDVSHLNAAGFWDVAREYDGPLIASHSGVHALCPSTRNLTDDQLDAVDLVGINFDTGSLREDGGDDADTPVERIAEHARYVADRIGVDHVALGSDFDGATMPAEVADASGLPRVLEALEGAGFGAPEVAQIASGNWRRVLAAAWG